MIRNKQRVAESRGSKSLKDTIKPFAIFVEGKHTHIQSIENFEAKTNKH